MTTNERGDMDHLLDRLEHQEGMLRRDPSRHHLHAADAMRDARAEITRLRERERRLVEALDKCLSKCLTYANVFGHDCEAMIQVRKIARAALADTAAPAAEREG